jgi:ankyrin repeat protein
MSRRRSAGKKAFAAAAALALLGASAGAQVVDDADPEEAGERPRLHPRRSVESQLRAAVRRGDFRIVQVAHGGTDDVGHISFGQETPGIACDGQLGRAAAHTLTASQSGATRFALAYNQALLAHPLFPDPDVCVWTGAAEARRRWPDFAAIRARPRHPEASVNRAARAGRPDLVRSLVAAGRPFDSHDRWWRRPLHWAARRGDVASLDILLAAGARTDMREPVPPLVLAVASNRPEAVDRLLAAAADPSACGRLDVRQSWGSTTTASAQVCPLRHAIQQGYAGPVRSLVRALAARGPDAEDGLAMALFEAVRLGRRETIEAFLDQPEATRRAVMHPSVMRAAAWRLDLPLLRRMIELGGGAAARSPAEERLWVTAAALPNPEPLALLVWFGGELNYLSAAERAELVLALPGLTAETIRPWLARAQAARDRLWDAIEARDHATLTALVRAGADLDERYGAATLAGAARTDLATVRHLLALGAAARGLPDEPDFDCGPSDEEFVGDTGATRRAAVFGRLCAEAEEARSRPSTRRFPENPIAVAIAAGKYDLAEALLPVTPPLLARETLESIVVRVEQRQAPPAQRALVGPLARIASQGPRRELPFALRGLIRAGETEAAEAMLQSFVPRGIEELSVVTQVENGDRCDAGLLRLLQRRGVDLGPYESGDGGNLFSLAAHCNSSEILAIAQAVPGLDANHLDAHGRRPLDRLARAEREGPVGRALVAMGARSCDDLPDSACRTGIEPDPSL